LTNIPSNQPASCELCTATGGDVLWRDQKCRAVLVADPDYAAYCRIIWNTHVEEMTDLSTPDQAHCMRVVLAVERALRNVQAPHKINLAAFGNMTPHLHWHVIPRQADDAHFPNPIWGERRRPSPPAVDRAECLRMRNAVAAELANLLS
jgi:diadenosine tetraphosphate (Ap4A) HIT family hydrolase